MTSSTHTKRKSFSDLMTDYNPSAQLTFARNPTLAVFGSLPELSVLRRVYGDNAPVMWLIPQLKNLSEYCGVKEKMTTEMLMSCAQVIATDYYYLKISELMYFFHRFKGGHYGEFYGAVDPLRITSALSVFVSRERNDIIDRKIQADNERRREEGRKGCISRDEYERLLKEEKNNKK